MDVKSWMIKKAERRRIDAFELWCWRRLLRVTWTARRCNQSILKEISPEYSWEGLMLKLKLQYFGHLTHLKRPWCWERLKAGGEGDDRWLDGEKGVTDAWTASLIQWVWVSSGSWWWTGEPGVLQSMGSLQSKSKTRLSDWTELRLFTSQLDCKHLESWSGVSFPHHFVLAVGPDVFRLSDTFLNSKESCEGGGIWFES